MIRQVKLFVGGLSAVLIAGCSGPQFIGRPDLQVSRQADLPAPEPTDLGVARESRVGPLDKIAVEVYGAPDLSRTVQVDVKGQASLPLIGTFDALGKTTAELATLVEGRIRGRYVRNPDVTVSIASNAQLITVDGQVKQPGLYPVLVGRMTLVRAIASAQGITDNADTNYVIVFRQAQGKQMAGLYDLRAIRQGIYPDPEVYPNDVVYVGEAAGRRIFQYALAGGGLLIAPLITILN